MKAKKFLIWILFVLLLLDTGFSFLQHYNATLEGDLPGIVYPSSSYQKVLDDPFGFSVIKNGESYPATNRYFAHQIMYSYFRSVPLWLQNFVSPIDSIYLSNAIIKTIIQLLLIYLLAIFVTGKAAIMHEKVLMAMVIIAPIFQATGYHEYFGIIDGSITYTMFYALGNLLILFFLLPFVFKYYYQKDIKFNLFISVGLLLLALVIAFHCATNSGVILVLCPFIVLLFWYKSFRKSDSKTIIGRAIHSITKIPKPIFYFFTLISLFCLYSFYIGTFNSENTWVAVPLSDRYVKLVSGLGSLVTFKLGQFLFFAILSFNVFFLFKQKKSEERDRIIQFFWIVIAFVVVYTLLLPLGGYRSYRPLIIRRDTIMPVLLALMVVYGMTSLFLYANFKPMVKKIYVVAIAAFLLVLTNADKLKGNRNNCERMALQEIALSTEDKIIIHADCSVMSWRKSNDFNTSDNAAHMLHYWRITNEPKWYKWE